MATYDRAAEDVGNIVQLEHVNVRIAEQRTGTLFYMVGLGLTRDPYLMVNIDNMWVNVGLQQFHLITNKPQVLRGVIGLVVQDHAHVVNRLERVKEPLAGTKFDWVVEDKHVSVTCPWGNKFRLHAPGPQFGDMTLGMPYVEFTVAPGQAPGVARFYEKVFETTATVDPNGGSPRARVRVGPRQELIFKETTEPIPAYDGHHIAVYVSNFSRAHDWLAERGLVTEESNPYQYRFNWITDPESGEKLFEIEHEVRSLTHPMYMRPMVNRNATQTQREYVRWRDPFWGGEYQPQHPLAPYWRARPVAPFRDATSSRNAQPGQGGPSCSTHRPTRTRVIAMSAPIPGSGSRMGREVIHMVTACEIMIRNIQTVAPEALLSTALAVMRDQDIRHLAVMKDDELVGVLSNRDYRRVLERTGPDGTIHGVDAITVSEIMTPARDVITARPDTPVLNIAQLMVIRKVGCIPVVDEQHRLIGLLTQKDVMQELTSARVPRPLPPQ